MLLKMILYLLNDLNNKAYRFILLQFYNFQINLSEVISLMLNTQTKLMLLMLEQSSHLYTPWMVL